MNRAMVFAAILFRPFRSAPVEDHVTPGMRAAVARYLASERA